MAFSIIIPSRTASNLVPCIRAIREAGETARIIVVDDFGSAVERGRFMDVLYKDRSLSATIVLERGEKPFVFARNVNIGIRAAGDDDVILLNDDALLKTPLGLSMMSRPPEWMPNFGVIAATCNNVGNLNQHQRPGNRLREEYRMVCFVCVYIPRATIDAVGILDERFVGYGLDDDDYCLRVRNAGMKLGVFDGCYVDHSSLRSSFRGPAGAGGDFSGNMRIFIEKWGTDNWGRDRTHSQFAHLFPPEAA